MYDRFKSFLSATLQSRFARGALWIAFFLGVSYFIVTIHFLWVGSYLSFHKVAIGQDYKVLSALREKEIDALRGQGQWSYTGFLATLDDGSKKDVPESALKAALEDVRRIDADRFRAMSKSLPGYIECKEGKLKGIIAKSSVFPDVVSPEDISASCAGKGTTLVDLTRDELEKYAREKCETYSRYHIPSEECDDRK